MINKKVMSKWKERKKSTIQRLYQIIKAKRKQSKNLLTQEEAAYICASEDGVDLHKYLSNEKVEKIRDLSNRFNQESKEYTGVTKTKIKYISKDKIFNFDKEYNGIKDSLLPDKIINEAKTMMKIYPKTYIFENSVRNIIRIVMIKKFGKNWWSQVDDNLQIKISNREKAEKQTPWIGKRGIDELCYCDIKDLIKIMGDNWESEFDFLGNQGGIFLFFSIIEKIRNIIAHNNLIEKDDIESLNVFLKSWTKIVEANKDNLI